MKSILIGTLAAILAAGAQSNEAERQLKAAMNAELVNGDLKAAIKQYGEIAAKYKTDRAVAAMALVRMAEAYKKLGDAESRKVYERVLREFSDQKEATALARAGIAAATTGSAGVVSRQVWTGPTVWTDGSISPDGRFVSFGATEDLRIHEIATGIDRRITTTSTRAGDYAEESVISRDGKQVAYAWFN